MIIRSFEGVQALTTPAVPSWSPGSSTSVNLNGASLSYKNIYATQPNVRTCVDFLATNVAQLSLQAFRRISDTDRERLVDHRIVKWLGKPNPGTGRYRLFEGLVGDIGIYNRAYWLKIRNQGLDGKDLGLLRLPPDEVTAKGTLFPTEFTWTRNGKEITFPRSEIVHFHGYNPINELDGLSRLETLRRVLAEESAAGEHREQFWRNAARIEGVIQQTKESPNYTEKQKSDFREQWQEFSQGGARAGQTPIVPKGMEIKPLSFSAKDSEYLSGRKQVREETAAQYLIPQPFVGILDHATFSNIKEQHKHLYQDTLGPLLEWLVEEITAQLLPECEDTEGVYLEFNIQAKLAGSFEEQSTSLQQLVGRPIMTANEGRARLNLPAITDDPTADQLAAQQGGPSATRGKDEPPGFARTDQEQLDETARVAAPVIAAARARQHVRMARLPVPERAIAFESQIARYDREIEADLLDVIPSARDARRLAFEANQQTLQRLRDEERDFRLGALEAKTEEPEPVATRRTFHRDPVSGLIGSYTDEPVQPAA